MMEKKIKMMMKKEEKLEINFIQNLEIKDMNYKMLKNQKQKTLWGQRKAKIILQINPQVERIKQLIKEVNLQNRAEREFKMKKDISLGQDLRGQKREAKISPN